MKDNPITWTYLPFDNVKYLGKIAIICVCLFVASMAIIALIKTMYPTMRRGTYALIKAYSFCLISNTLIFGFLFWYFAIPVSICASIVFARIAKNEIKTSYEDEREGKRGLRPALRKALGEDFSDLPPDEQVALKEKMCPTKFNMWLFFALTNLIPFGIMILLYFLNFTYIFIPHAK